MHARHRQLIEVVSELGDAHLSGAEIGVYTGATAKLLLSYFQQLHLTLIDPWESPPKSSGYYKGGDPMARHTQQEFNKMYKAVRNATAFAEERVQIWRMNSLLGSQKIGSMSLDFAFIDADHSFESVIQDCEQWWPKIRPGGFLIGHDYGNCGSWTRDVKRAWTLFSHGADRAVNVGEGYVCWMQK